MSAEMNKIFSILTYVGLFGFAVLNAPNVITLVNGLTKNAVTYTQGIAGMSKVAADSSTTTGP